MGARPGEERRPAAGSPGFEAFPRFHRRTIKCNFPPRKVWQSTQLADQNIIMSEPQNSSPDFNRREFLKGSSFATLMTMMGGVQLFAQAPPEQKGETKEKK